MTPRIEFQPSICVCTPMRAIPNEDGGSHLEPITIQWHRAMKMLLCPMGYNVGEIRIDGFETGDARSKAAQEAMDRGMKYLMFIDADTIPSQRALQLLTYHLDNNPDYDIAAGLYTQKQDPQVPLIWNKWGEGTFCDFTLGDVLRDGIVAAGTGCMLIRVSLFERLTHSEETPWFKTERGEGTSPQADYQYEMSDDIYFCRRAVQEAGAKILVDTNVYCRHIDWKTGREYQLRDDALPVRRLAERMVKQHSDQWLSREEETALQRLATQSVERAGGHATVVEVGSFLGRSSKAIAGCLGERGKLYCVDTWQGTPKDGSGSMVSLIGGQQAMLNLFKANLRTYIDSDVVVPVIGESVTSATHLAKMGIQADMVFIDADHERCGEDIAAWMPLLKPGGIICGHDYDAKFPAVCRDVSKAFGEVERAGTLWYKVSA